jgi:hypothetical protein
MMFRRRMYITKYMSEYLIPYEHNTQENILESLRERLEKVSMSSLELMMQEEPHIHWPLILNNIESNGSIYELLRYALGRAILGIGPDSYEVHPEEDLFIYRLDREESPMLLLNCPESTILLSLEQTLEYIEKHKDSEMEVHGTVKDLEFWWEENPLGLLLVQKEYFEDMTYYW